MTLASIVQIPVDDSEFSKFAAAFSDYQEKLKEQPAIWQETNARIIELARVQRQLGVSSDRAFANATTAAVAYEKTVKSAVSAESHLGRGAKNGETAMHRMATSAKSMSTSLFGAVRSLTKFATFGLGAGILGIGGSLFGLDRLADSVLASQRGAQGLGLTVGQYNSFRANMAQYAGVSVLSGAAAAQMDLSKAGWLASLGISWKKAVHEPATALVGQEIMAIHRAYQANPTAIMNTAAGQAAGQLGFSPADIRNIGLASSASLRSAIAATQKNATSLGFTARVAQEWIAFSIQLKKAGILIETALINTLTPLTPQLTRLSREFAAMIVGLEKSGEVKKWIADLGAALNQFTNWLGSPAFQQDMRTIAYYFSEIAKGIGAVARYILGPVPAAPGENNYLNAKTTAGGWAGYGTKNAATDTYMRWLVNSQPYANKNLVQQIAVWNGHGANSAEYAKNVSVWAGQMLGMNHPLEMTHAYRQYSPEEQTAILSAMSRMEGHFMPMSALLPEVLKWDRAHNPMGIAPVAPSSVAPKSGPALVGHQIFPGGTSRIPVAPPGVVPKNVSPPGAHQIFPGGTSLAPTSDTAKVRDRYWQRHHGVNVKVQNSTAAQTFVSANAATAQ